MDALRPFLLSVTAILMIIVLNVAFATGPLADVTVALATALFAFTFAFADLAKNTLASFQFLFIRQPFDIGDRVEVRWTAASSTVVEAARRYCLALVFVHACTFVNACSGECVHSHMLAPLPGVSILHR